MTHVDGTSDFQVKSKEAYVLVMFKCAGFGHMTAGPCAPLAKPSNFVSSVSSRTVLSKFLSQDGHDPVESSYLSSYLSHFLALKPKTNPWMRLIDDFPKHSDQSFMTLPLFLGYYSVLQWLGLSLFFRNP
jgi:hypothetical protein